MPLYINYLLGFICSSTNFCAADCSISACVVVMFTFLAVKLFLLFFCVLLVLVSIYEEISND